MGSLIDDEDLPFVIKKIWCHGQSVLPPIIGIASMSYAIYEPSSCVSVFWLGFVVPLVMFVWPFLSWKAVVEATSTMVATTPITLLEAPLRTTVGAAALRNPSIWLWRGGIFMVIVYLSILVTTIKDCREKDDERHLTGLGLLLMIFSALAAIETMAFLVVVATCLRSTRRQFDA